MMIKRRIDEDFKHVWAINWNGLPEDFSDATEIVLTSSVFGKKTILERGIDYAIEGNLIKVDFTPRFATISGIYNLELKYIKPSDGFFDGERRSAIDIDVVQIVARSSQVTDTGDITSTSEAAFGFQGLSAYEVWLKDNPGKTKEDYFAYLRQPAIDAGASISELEGEIQVSEGLRIQAESERVQAESERQITIQEATTAASLADTARLSIQTDLAQKADHGYETSPKTLKQVDDSLVQLADEVNLKELRANKQNDLTVDGTGTKFPTVDAVNAGLQPKLVSGTNIKTVNGESLLGSGDVSNLIATYTHTTNTVIQPTALDPITGIFTCNNHGLTQDKIVLWNMNRNHNLLPYQVIPIEINGGQFWNYYADVIDANSFKIKKSPTDTPLTYASAGDITKWHFEINAVSSVSITNLPAYKKIKVITKFISNSNNWFQLYPSNVGGGVNNWYIGGAITNAHAATLNSFGANMPAYVESYFDFGEISTIRHKLYGFAHVHTSPTTVTRITPADLCWINFNNLGALTITELSIGSPSRALLNGTTVEIYKL